ncbi:RNA polymerase sigma factor [Cytobacillus pseudoceanisediminis]|jgi:RNA polymerase sigma factor (sigma-70 family)|uniref:RNA polymerase sigma factor n=1 Tax=Cytobacillus pseudoceanisediminis TaxID=3051614 RepID=UPI003C3088B8
MDSAFNKKFENIMEPFVAQLKNYCYQLTGYSWEGEDLLQETLMKAYSALLSNPSREITKTYLYRIASTTWIDMTRRKKIKTTFIEEDIIDATPSSQRETREFLELLSEQLPVRQSVILLLVDVFNLTAKETAFHIKATESAVNSALQRARAKLKTWNQQLQTDSTVKKEIKTTYPTQLFESFVKAFELGDPEKIYIAYNEVTNSGVSIELSNLFGHYTFFIKDPDGNKFLLHTINRQFDL